MARYVRALAALTGVVCVVIGLSHVAIGADAIPGGGEVNATIDSEDRFYGAVFAGYGAAWVWAALRVPATYAVIQLLAAVMLLGGIGRVLSLIDRGAPHPLFIGLTVVEFVVPAIVFGLTRVPSRRA